MKKTLKSWLLVGCAAGLALSLASTAKAQLTVPNGSGMVRTFDLDGNVTDSQALVFQSLGDPQRGFTFQLVDPATNQLSNSIGLDLGGTTITLGGAGTFDPVLSYSFAATNNNVGITPFEFDLSIPIAAVQAGSLIKSSLTIGITDQASDGVQVTPYAGGTFPNGFLQTMTGNTSPIGFGTDLGFGSGTGIDIGTTFNAGGNPSASTTVFSTPGTTSPIAFSYLDVHLEFTLTGGGDNASFTGRVEVVDVPEPGTVAMIVGLGVSSSVFAIRRKRNAKRAA